MARENRELCMLAIDFDATKHRMGGMWLSEKMDGLRALWLPVTRGKKVFDIPFANHDKKTKDYTATGLWSRYGNPIFVPDWFTIGWPDHPLDGELWCGRGNFQDTMSAVKKYSPIDSEWMKVSYNVFESPQYTAIFADGRVNNPNYKKTMRLMPNLEALGITEIPRSGYLNTFDTVFRLLQRDLIQTGTLKLHPHRQLPFNTDQARTVIFEELERVTDQGGEGLMLRHPGSEWEPIRSKWLMKVKKLYDAEARVVGYRAGQGKYLGMLGSLTVEWEHGRFELSGFTDAERQLCSLWQSYALANPGELMPSHNQDNVHPSLVFPINAVVTFRYRELTDDKMPKEARYLRKYVPV